MLPALTGPASISLSVIVNENGSSGSSIATPPLNLELRIWTLAASMSSTQLTVLASMTVLAVLIVQDPV